LVRNSSDISHNVLVAVGVTERGTVVAGRRRAEKTRAEARPRQWGQALLLVVGVLVASAAWLFLVRASITFGQLARDGRGAAWAVCAAGTVGAAVCLLLVFVLLTRLWTLLGLRSDYRPRRSSGGRRSK
jgi:hypothetical protein